MIRAILNIISGAVIRLIRVYQLVVSPHLGPSCRHVPTCSQYMIEAIEVHGIARGLWLGLRRLSHCHPWGSSGYDPVPPKNRNPDSHSHQSG